MSDIATYRLDQYEKRGDVQMRVAGVIYWLFAAIAIMLIASSAPNNRSGWDIGQVLAGAVVYAIGRDMRHVLRG